ncbi:glycosyltransferase family 2 protein [Sinomonas susongensis]|uniref:glycosyltransferase family 2 protein n=1 Tax=Sinomonas susongensis TaxID=1324851 RepID=UPI00110846F3|nr:glycosyltransferase [Sinomonas susongensis]
MRRPEPSELKGRPLISVVIPCYNYGHYLPGAVDSALSQSDVDVEVLIVDDASTDGSAIVAQELAAREARVSAVLHTANLGHIATYNDGLGRCRGDYVVLLSADDLLAPGSLARSAALFESWPDTMLVYGRAPSFEKEPVQPRRIRVNWTVWDGAEWVGEVCRRGTNVIANPEAIVRREVVERLGGYEAVLPHTADLHFWLRAASMGGVGRIGGPPQAFYRIHGANMHLGENDLSDLVERSEMFDALLGELPPGELRSLVGRALAEEALSRAAREYDLGRSEGPLAEQFVRFALAQGVDVRQLEGWKALDRRRAALTGPRAQAFFLSVLGRSRRWAGTKLEQARISRTGVA